MLRADPPRLVGSLFPCRVERAHRINRVEPTGQRATPSSGFLENIPHLQRYHRRSVKDWFHGESTRHTGRGVSRSIGCRILFPIGISMDRIIHSHASLQLSLVQTRLSTTWLVEHEIGNKRRQATRFGLGLSLTSLGGGVPKPSKTHVLLIFKRRRQEERFGYPRRTWIFPETVNQSLLQSSTYTTLHVHHPQRGKYAQGVCTS